MSLHPIFVDFLMCLINGKITTYLENSLYCACVPKFTNATEENGFMTLYLNRFIVLHLMIPAVTIMNECYSCKKPLILET